MPDAPLPASEAPPPVPTPPPTDLSSAPPSDPPPPGAFQKREVNMCKAEMTVSSPQDFYPNTLVFILFLAAF